MSLTINAQNILAIGYMRQGDAFCGTVGDYYVGIYAPTMPFSKMEMLSAVFPTITTISISAHKEDDTNNNALRAAMGIRLASGKTIKDVRIDSYGIIIKIKTKGNAAKNTKNINEVIGDAIGYLKEHDYVSGCIGCGEKEGNFMAVDKGVYYVCQQCLASNKPDCLFKTKETNANEISFEGITLAALFSLVGVAIWVILGIVNIIAGIAGAAIIYGALKGYETAAGRLNRKAIFCCIGISLFMMILSTFLYFAFAFWKELGSLGYSFFDIFFNLIPLISYSENWGYFILDLFEGVAFSALSGWRIIKECLDEEKTQGKPFRLDWKNYLLENSAEQTTAQSEPVMTNEQTEPKMTDVPSNVESAQNETAVQSMQNAFLEPQSPVIIAQPNENVWICPLCGKRNENVRFCTCCGGKRPKQDGE